MAKVKLNFSPPLENNIVALKVFEAPDSAGPFTQKIRTTAIGTYPDYISWYTLAVADNATDWFAIQWEDADGIFSEMSSPIQGGTTTLVQILVDRMMLRDPTLDENIATQEAQAVISDYYTVLDPLTVDPDTVSPAILSGLTLLALARTYLFVTVTSSGAANKWTAGLVSMDSSTSASSQTKQADLKSMIDMANTMLGRGYSLIGLMTEIEVAGGLKQLQPVTTDLSRVIVEVQ